MKSQWKNRKKEEEKWILVTVWPQESIRQTPLSLFSSSFVSMSKEKNDGEREEREEKSVVNLSFSFSIPKWVFAWVREVVNIGSFFLFFLSDVAVRNQDEEDTAIRPRERRKYHYDSSDDSSFFSSSLSFSSSLMSVGCISIRFVIQVPVLFSRSLGHFSSFGIACLSFSRLLRILLLFHINLVSSSRYLNLNIEK